jgi:hypothetical protein
METLFYLAGVLLSGYAGYVGLEWYFIFFGSVLMAIGHAIKRAPQLYTYYKRDGIIAVPKIFILQIALMSIVTSIVYFVAVGVDKLLS